jgi:hypothetical protein
MKRGTAVFWIFIACATAFVTSGCRRNESTNVNSKITLAAIEGFKKDALNTYRTLRLTNGKADALRKTVEWASTQEMVKRANIASDRETIAIILQNGIEIDIVVE